MNELKHKYLFNSTTGKLIAIFTGSFINQSFNHIK
jgi:hypothetical protein